MATSEKVTVDRADFDALLRRANFHTGTHSIVPPNTAHVMIAKVEYDSLLRNLREYDLLKSALFQGGITSETLDVLIAGNGHPDTRKDSGISMGGWADDSKDQMSKNGPQVSQADLAVSSWRDSNATPNFSRAPGSGPNNLNQQSRQPSLQNANSLRQISFAATPSLIDANGFDEQDDDLDGGRFRDQPGVQFYQASSGEQCTLYFAGLAKQTTYRDLLSVVKGGKIVSMAFRPERNAVVTFLDGAANFLAWVKREDLYLHSKRIEVRWAERQFKLNDHIRNKICNGATRNIVVHNASRNGLTDSQIRDDMEHIHNLDIVDIVFRDGDAYVSTNSVHNALFARTCMLSRTSYKGCKIEFYRDECDVPLPARTYLSRAAVREPAIVKAPLSNRFGCLDIDDGHGASDEENREPVGYDSHDNDTLEMSPNLGVSLNFLDIDD